MMITLYHSYKSRSSNAVWLMEETGQPYDLQHVTIRRQDGSGSVDEKNPHPDKKVPALAHNGQLITEQAAIYLYVSDLFPDSKLGPQVGDDRRGAFLSWLAYYAGVVEPVVMLKLSQIEHDDLYRTFRSTDEMHQRLLNTLSKHDYIVGDEFTAVDILYSGMGKWYRQALPEGEVVDRYIERSTNRPAFEQALARDQPS